MEEHLFAEPLALIVISLLVALNVWLAHWLWTLCDRVAQDRWAAQTTFCAIILGGFIAWQRGDQDLSPIGIVGLGLIFLAACMLTRAWSD